MTHRREQAGNHSTSIRVTDSILRLPANTLGSLLLLFPYLTRPCSAKGVCPSSWASQVQGVTSALTVHQQRQTGRVCSLPGFSILIQEEVNRTQSKIKKVQKLELQKLELLLSQQLSLGFTKRDYSFINVCVLRSLGLGKKHK